MAVDKKKHDARYQGTKGKLNAFFDQPVNAHNCDKLPLSKALKMDIESGLAWNVTGTDANMVASTIAGIGMGAGAFMTGLMFLISGDGLVLDSLEVDQLVNASADLNIANDGAVIFSRGEDRDPYLFRRDGERVYIYEAARSTQTDGPDDASELEGRARVEWTLLSPVDAYDVLLDFQGALSHYENVENNQQVEFFNRVSPIFQYSAEGFSADYTEGWSRDIVRMTSENHFMVEENLSVESITTLDMAIDGFAEDMINNGYGYLDGESPLFDDGQLVEATLDPVSGFYWGTMVPFYLLGGLALGSGRAVLRTANTAISNGRSQRKTPSL